MHPKSFLLDKARRQSVTQVTEDKLVLRIDREALNSDKPVVRFAGLAA